MKRVLISLKVIQVVDNEKRNKDGLKRLGRGFFEAKRLNPKNPLSYLLLIIIYVLGTLVSIILFGLLGTIDYVREEKFFMKPFNWY